MFSSWHSEILHQFCNAGVFNLLGNAPPTILSNFSSAHGKKGRDPLLQVIGIHLLSEKAICSGASGVHAASTETLYHSA